MNIVFKKIYHWKKQLTFTVVSGMLVTLFVWFNPRTASNEKHDSIIGRWSFDYSRIQSGITELSNGKTTYYSTGKYNVVGNITYKWNENIIAYRIDGAGKWDVYDNRLIVSLEDMKSIPTKIIYSGKAYKESEIALLKKLDFPSLEKIMAKGKSQSYIIKKRDDDKLNLEVDNLYGDDFNIELTREK